MARGEVDMFQFFVAFSAILLGTQNLGSIFSFAPDISKAKSSATEMKTLFDRTPGIDIWSRAGGMIQSLQGHIEFRNVHFQYPTRPDQPVLSGINLTVKPGQYIALVGASGCGKSTAIALLERFYDPSTGSIFVDGQDISKLNIKAYRRSLAVVSQEPTLYQGTIRDNVLLGAEGDDMPEEEIVKACKAANIYDFVMSLP